MEQNRSRKAAYRSTYSSCTASRRAGCTGDDVSVDSADEVAEVGEVRMSEKSIGSPVEARTGGGEQLGLGPRGQ